MRFDDFLTDLLTWWLLCVCLASFFFSLLRWFTFFSFQPCWLDFVTLCARRLMFLVFMINYKHYLSAHNKHITLELFLSTHRQHVSEEEEKRARFLLSSSSSRNTPLCTAPSTRTRMRRIELGRAGPRVRKIERLHSIQQVARSSPIGTHSMDSHTHCLSLSLFTVLAVALFCCTTNCCVRYDQLRLKGPNGRLTNLLSSFICLFLLMPIVVRTIRHQC